KPAAKKPAAKKLVDAAPAEIMVNVTMWEPVLPLERGERYEDPLFAVLEDSELGGPGDGGGTLTGAGGEIEQIDFDVAIASVDAIPLITQHLEAAGAPKGSVLRYELDGQDHELAFGATEGIAIYLDGITQPAAIYESTSAQELVDRLLASLPSAQLRGSWQGPEETALYLYGADAEQMWTVVEPVLRDYPLSRNARVVVRHGNPANHPREVRLAAS
ncbi:MAG: hypothetical protein NT062_25685, partial [Proteobacteria bacterium]|nr:hypothetical protein [Pseudomonadota bacterium]